LFIYINIYIYTHTHTHTHTHRDKLSTWKLTKDFDAHNKTSYLSSHYLLISKYAKIFMPYRNYRKSSEAHCGQHNQKVATERDIHCVFQLLNEPVD